MVKYSTSGKATVLIGHRAFNDHKPQGQNETATKIESCTRAVEVYEQYFVGLSSSS